MWLMHLAHEIIGSAGKSADRFAGSADALVRTEREARIYLPIVLETTSRLRARCCEAAAFSLAR